MRALVFEQFGEPAEVLRVQDVPEPEPGPGEVQVRMLLSPINPSDLFTVRGLYGKLPKLPATPGFEGVGIVEKAGGGMLASFMKGKRVAVLNRERGNWQEKTIVPAKQVIPIAKDIPTEQAAMFFVNPATAYAMSAEVLKVPQGEWLLSTAAASALGKMLICLCKARGIRTINVIRRPEQVQELKQLGADEVIVFDADQAPAEELISKAKTLSGGGVKYAVDPVGGKLATAVIECLGIGGQLLLYSQLTREPIQLEPRSLITPAAMIQGFWLTRFMDNLSLPQKLRIIGKVTKWMRKGVLVSEVGESYPLERIAEAVRKAEEPGRGGKVLLKIGEA